MATDTNAALTAALNSLATALAAFNAAGDQRTAPEPVLDPFESNQPFDLASRAGASAFTTASKPLDVLWDGSASQFPTFVVALITRAREVKWNAPAPQGILTINNRNVLQEYHALSSEDISTARQARTNPRAVQNAKTMFHCLKSSITGDIKAQLFHQLDNAPEHEDGITLFYRLTQFTMASSLQLSLNATEDLLHFDPAAHQFSIPIINTKMAELFMLATNGVRPLDQDQRLQHLLRTYDRIKQPDDWTQWVREQKRDFQKRQLTNAQDLMNAATIQYANIISERNGIFPGSLNSVRDDIVAMLAVKKRKVVAPSKDDDTQDKPKVERPPFLRHYKSSAATDATLYKVGDKKIHQGTNWFFCDCPTHKNGVRWHTYPATECRIRAKWIAEKGEAPAANIAEVSSTPAPEIEPDVNSITSYLATAFNNSTSDEVRDQIALLLEAITHNA